MSEDAPHPTRTKTRDGEDDPSRSQADFGDAGADVRPAAEPAPRAEAPDHEGETIGRFRVISRLGEGGMGVVYAAEDTRLGRTVALKVLSREAVHREDRRLRFLREARAASAVMHPNIATIFEVGEHEGEVFLAMERVLGETLRRTIRRREKPMPVAEAIRIVREIAAGLREAHAADIVHRDLKPENVMITPDGQVKILDFGLAKRVNAEPAAASEGSPTADLATREGQILGTAGYMAPEQALGEPVDPRTDLFALGVILYELLTQTRPFDGDTRVAVMMATYRDPAAPPSSRNPAISPAVDALVLKCLEKRPEDRFPSAAALIEALSNPALTGDLAAPEPPVLRRPALPGKTERRQAPLGSTWLLGAAGLAAIAGVAIVGQRFAQTTGDVPSASSTTGTLPPPGGSETGAQTGTLPGLSRSGTAAPTGTLTGPGDASTTSAADPAADSASAAATPPAGTPRRPCLKGDPGMATACEGRPAVAWCDATGRAIGCCGKGLVPKGADGICVCPPGGTAIPEALARGCEPVSPTWEAGFTSAKRAAMDRSIACFQPETHPKSISGGTFEARFFLTPEGDVFDARVKLSTMPDDRGQACAVAAVRAVRFPPPPGEEAGQPLGFGFVFNK